LRHRAPRAFSSYLATFLLVGVAVGGSGVVYEASLGYAGGQSAGIRLQGASIRQGAGAAVLTVEAFNLGQAPITWLVFGLVGVPSSASFCYSLSDTATRATLADNCPTFTVNPTTVTIPQTIAPGGGVLVELTILGSPFVVGNGYLVSLTASSGVSQSSLVTAVSG
jgi:hypothetical protein